MSPLPKKPLSPQGVIPFGVNGAGEQKTAAVFLPVRDDKNGAVPSANAELEEKIEELRETKQRLKIEIEGLKSEIEELNETRNKTRSLNIEQHIAALVRLLRNEPDAKRIEVLKKLNMETVIAKADSDCGEEEHKTSHAAAPAPTISSETPPPESPLKGNDPGPIPECLLRKPTSPAPAPSLSRTSQK